MAKAIMIQGTMSNVGKSLLTAGLCRIFKQDGYRVAPFKSQNMALNSFITADGLEMGRAQVVQAEACGIEPDVRMNPILLKPVTDMGSQVIVHGEVLGNYRAVDYFKMKKSLIPDIRKAYDSLAAAFDIIVIEGAGSPAEINLKQDDIVNMGMAKMANAPVLLVGDIDRGGVFAQLYGTLALLEPEERAMIKATVINKFRGDIEILRPGLAMLEERTDKPVAGVIPYMRVDIDEEDSLTERFSRRGPALLDIAVIRSPRIANFTDFLALEAMEGVGLRYVEHLRDVQKPDMIFLPGTKNTLADLRWLRESGFEAAIKKLAAQNVPIFGICGGYQMLGEFLVDAANAEGGGSMAGLGLLPVRTEFLPEKRRTRVSGQSNLGFCVEGYEMHMGRSEYLSGAQPLLTLENGEKDGCHKNAVFGSYVHGFFDETEARQWLLRLLCEKKGLSPEQFVAPNMREYKQKQYDILARSIRDTLDMHMVYSLLEAGV